MTLTTAERIHFATALVTFHLDNRKKKKSPTLGKFCSETGPHPPRPIAIKVCSWITIGGRFPPFQPKPAAGGRDFSSVAVPVSVYCGTLCGVFDVLRHCSTATIVPAPPPLHLHRHQLQCGSDRRPTKMLTRALVRASRALPGILTRAHATYEGAACRRKALRST